MWCSQDLPAKKDVQYVAGGATQNSIRAAQWLLQVPEATAYFGSVGKDEYADKLREAATAGGVHVSTSAERHSLRYIQDLTCVQVRTFCIRCCLRQP